MKCVRVHRAISSILLILAIAFPGTVLSKTFPAEGFWFNRAEPGSGLTIEQQANILVVTVYTYAESGEPIWGLASGPYDGGEVFEAPLLIFEGGSPIEASSFHPTAAAEERSLTLRFFGDVYASLSIDDSEPQPIVPQQFGWHPQGENIVSPFEEVKYLIPDFDAAWLVAPNVFGAEFTTRVESIGVSLFLDPIPEFDPLEGIIPGFSYQNGDKATFTCDTTARTPDIPDACRMPAQRDIWPEDLIGLYVMPVSSIDWHVWRGTLFFAEKPVVRMEQFLEPQPADRQFVAHRLGNSSYDVFDFDFEHPEHSFGISNGMWWIPSRSGSGLVMEQKETVLVVTVFTYDDLGSPVWYLASGNLESPRRFVGDLLSFADGTPFQVDHLEHTEPEVTGSRNIRIEFLSANFAEVSIEGGEPFEIRSFNFGHSQSFQVTRRFGEDDFRDRSFPDLTGHWEFGALDLSVDRTLSLMIGTPVRVSGGFTYPAQDPTGAAYTVECSAKGPKPKCFVTANASDTRVLRFEAGDIGTDRILADYAHPSGIFGPRSRNAWGFRIEPIQ